MSTLTLKKPRLGQHWLVNPRLAAKIVKAAEFKTSDTALEIGPGKGILTSLIAKEVGRLIAVEKDQCLAKKLKFLKLKNVEIFERDILQFPLPEKATKIIGSIPYYLTGKILRKFRGFFCLYLVQMEVAKRAMAMDKRESILSISLKAWGTPELIAKVSKGSFFPQPKVDSAILKITPLEKPRQINMSLVKKAFREKRKQIGSTLNKKLLKKSGIDPTKRPENLSLEEWITLSLTFGSKVC